MTAQTTPPPKTFVLPDLIAILCAVAILLAFFFMPWLGILKPGALAFLVVPDTLSDGNALFYAQSLFAVALVPIAAVFALVIERRGAAKANPSRYKAIGFVIAGLLVLLFYNGFFVLLLGQQLQVDGELVSSGAVFGFGFWLALLAGAALLLQVFRLFDGLRGKLVVAFTAVFAIVFALAYFWFFQFSTQTALNRVVEDMRATLAGTVAGIHGDDMRDLLAEVPETPGVYPTDQRYWDHVQWFGTILQIEPRAIVYSYTFGAEPGTIVYVGSVGAVFTPPVGVQFKEACPTCAVGDNLQTLESQETLISTDINTDAFGSWITGNAPFFDSDGNLVGAVGLDYEASYVLQIQQNILNSIVLSFELAYVVLFGLVYVLAGALTNPLRKLASIAKLVGEGQYEKANFSELTPSTGYPDEIDQLGGVLADMTQKVYRREETLKQQVKELKIEIDQVKAKQQIKEIVETEFFDAIAAKARNMRQRHARAGEDTPET
ncbi:MAG: hypothetical protein HXY40_18010 [Chloroflexi bacterium]|nr:hypothetical protein [Chloroflexota bacterium]